MDWHRINFVFLITLLIQYSNHMVRCAITDVQLVGGPSSNKGTVEIRQDGGDWETTCGINLDINDVIVICRQLGFPGASLAMQTTPFRQNSNPDIGLNCYGSEGNVTACPTFSHASGCSSAGAASCHGEGYLGCFKDVSDDRALSSKFSFYSTSMSISYCIQLCQDTTVNNYRPTYAGVEGTYVCYCGEARDNYTRHGVGVDSDCSFPCHGDPTDSCGSSGYIAIFMIHVQTSETTSTIASTWPTEEIQHVSTQKKPITSQQSYEMTSDIPPTISPTWSTSEIQDISTQKKPITTQPSSEITSGHSKREDLTSSPIATTFFSTLQLNSHSSYFGAVVGEGVVIILLSVLLMVSVIYIIRIRKMMKNVHKDQKTHQVDLFQSSSLPEKDTGFYHDIQDVMKSDPSATSDGDTYYSSQIYEHKRSNVLDPDDTSAPHHSYMI